jgi:hypothetical protein
MLKKSIIIILSAISLVIAESRSTFYLLPSPAPFTIYNEYEQSLSQEELARFPPYAPLRLVAVDVQLGDGISHAAKFRFGNEFFFLLKDASGRFVGENRKNEPPVMSNCEALDDTVKVTKGGVLTVAQVSGPVRTVAQGRKLARVFRCKGRYYVLSFKGTPFCGWSSLEPVNAWRRIGMASVRSTATRSVDTLIPQSLQERIRGMVMAANEGYRRFFSHFDSLTGAEKSFPQWRCECTASQCRCILPSPYDRSDDLSESTRELRTEIENLLLGTGCILTGGRGEIVVIRERQRQ